MKDSDTDLTPTEAIKQIQHRITVSGAAIRSTDSAEKALSEAIRLYNSIQNNGLKLQDDKDIITAIQAEHLCLTSIAVLRAIVELLKAGSGSRGSHLVLTKDGIQIHPDITDRSTGQSLRFKPENKELRNCILRIRLDKGSKDLFHCETVPVRPAPTDRKAFEPAWADYREGKIYNN